MPELVWESNVRTYLVLLICQNIVLVAHNGFAFDFSILFAEVESRESLGMSTFSANNIHFSDSLPLLRMVITILVMCQTKLI